MQHAPADRQRAEQRLVQSLSPQVRPVRLNHVSPAHQGLGRWECFLQPLLKYGNVFDCNISLYQTEWFQGPLSGGGGVVLQQVLCIVSL